ncbi:hypothetical protein FIBSPDRAFT_889250 [Athelia psychrophila]|uniref:Uncharacterized protein n=1 Tax=Athelia psychrophila TaxID=1759441 RepID=A0A166MIF6_9AGAM|nr:hypothetical protein FIBSPDRAFT_889250 [Fibularhizoctonia sp. CBS 109695]
MQTPPSSSSSSRPPGLDAGGRGEGLQVHDTLRGKARRPQATESGSSLTCNYGSDREGEGKWSEERGKRLDTASTTRKQKRKGRETLAHRARAQALELAESRARATNGKGNSTARGTRAEDDAEATTRAATHTARARERKAQGGALGRGSMCRLRPRHRANENENGNGRGSKESATNGKGRGATRGAADADAEAGGTGDRVPRLRLSRRCSYWREERADERGKKEKDTRDTRAQELPGSACSCGCSDRKAQEPQRKGGRRRGESSGSCAGSDSDSGSCSGPSATSPRGGGPDQVVTPPALQKSPQHDWYFVSRASVYTHHAPLTSGRAAAACAGLAPCRSRPCACGARVSRGGGARLARLKNQPVAGVSVPASPTPLDITPLDTPPPGAVGTRARLMDRLEEERRQVAADATVVPLAEADTDAGVQAEAVLRKKAQVRVRLAAAKREQESERVLLADDDAGGAVGENGREEELKSRIRARR